jgi:hypothetical protein
MFSNAQFNGKGVRDSGDSYEGEFRNGDKQGQGVYIFADGTRVEGNWKDGQIQK